MTQRSTESFWSATSDATRYPSLHDQRFLADVVIVGAGITGVTAAMALQAQGRAVILLDAHRVAGGVSAGTSGHLTAVLDTRYRDLIQRFGVDATQLVVQSSQLAIDHIEKMQRDFGIDCGFERVSGFLFTERDDQKSELEGEAEACSKAGLACELSMAPLAFPTKAALRFPHQAQFHPRGYLLPLVARFASRGGQVFENTHVIAVHDGEPCTIHTQGGGEIMANNVILATHSPLNRVLVQTKLAQYRSYVISGTVTSAPPGLFWDMEDPYHYVRGVEMGGHSYLIVGGQDHKTAIPDDGEQPYEALRRYGAKFGLVDVVHRWSAQVVEPADGLPFIGRNAAAARVYVATGFSGNGLTFGTLAGLMLADQCLERPNPFADLYHATRMPSVMSLPTYLGENADFPFHFLADWMRPAEVDSTQEIARGDGKILRVRGKRLAVYRDDGGRLHALSPVCTHMGCMVKFNGTECSWDCACHGSRFDTQGQVLDGPAKLPLASKSIDETPAPAPKAPITMDEHLENVEPHRSFPQA